jgi:hypothetical protein
MSSGGLHKEARPLLCLFDRNFDLTTVLQHVWWGLMDSARHLIRRVFGPIPIV